MQGLRFQRPRAGLAVRSQPARADLSRERDHAAVPVQRLLSGGGRARGRRRRLRARSRRPRRRQEDLDARRALRAAAGDPDHPPHLRRGLERDRQVDRARALASSCAASAPTRRAKYVWFRCAEGYSTTIDMATALHPQTQMTFKFDDEILPPQVRLPDEDAHPDQARLQEPEARHRDGRHQQLNPAATGKSRATTGSAAVDRPRATWKARRLTPRLR